MHIDFKPGSKTDSFCAADDAGLNIAIDRAERGDASNTRTDAATPGESDSGEGLGDAQVEAVDGDVAIRDAEVEIVDSGAIYNDSGARLDGGMPNSAALLLALGAACTESGQCSSGHCTDGVCCDSADCEGRCQACNTPGRGVGTCTRYDDSDLSTTNDAPTGTCPNTCTACDGRTNDCVNVPIGLDWKNVCTTMPAESCGTTGACDGMGMCQFHGQHTPCDDGLYCDGPDTCDGAGKCSHAGDPCTGVACGSCDEASKSCRNKETWYDSVNDLTWEITPSESLLSWSDAFTYCMDKAHCGNDHWRLPSIGELRLQLRGCASTSDVVASNCVVNDSLNFESLGPACSGCATVSGPAPGGCYRPTELDGPCGHYWSSTPTANSSGTPTGNAWVILYGAAKLEWFPLATKVRVRCVRSGG